jgi:hypothetical protein
MLAYLLSSGADVNATSAYGDSPLTDAAEQDRTAAMDLLKRHGGKAIEGTPEQRDAAIKATVRRTDSTPCVDAQQGVPADAARPAGERRD